MGRKQAGPLDRSSRPVLNAGSPARAPLPRLGLVVPVPQRQAAGRQPGREGPINHKDSGAKQHGGAGGVCVCVCVLPPACAVVRACVCVCGVCVCVWGGGGASARGLTVSSWMPQISPRPRTSCKGRQQQDVIKQRTSCKQQQQGVSQSQRQ